jgi:hypothetical protein
MWPLIAAFLIVFAAIEWARWIWSVPPGPVVATFAAVVVSTFAIFKFRRTLRRMNQLYLGRDGELTVAEILDPLRARGYRVFNEIAENGYNIDHVLIGPPGLFVIETKTASLREGIENKVQYDGTTIRINGQIPDRDPIKQVRACADRVREILTGATERQMPIYPVVLYPGWWVDPLPEGVDFWVLNPKALPSFLEREPRRLSDADVAQIASTLASYQRAKAMAK